jgi:hypothetical protein
MNYSQQLRVIGQAIESRRMPDFTIRSDGPDYLILGEPVGNWAQFRLTPEELERLDGRGRRNRRDDKQAPDFHRPSNVLRAIGFYLDNRRAQLNAIAKRELMLTLELETAEGTTETEIRSIPNLYDLSLRMYNRRSNLAES